jgi:hypothetical protein
MKILDVSFVKLASSALARVAYEQRRQLLHVEFRDGSAYVYLDVPPAVYHELLGSQSQGSHFNKRIRNTFAHIDCKRS